ncbi:hypothetical protein PSYCG_09380 [Psychrobacter sp. G]|uniref:hypothetical protein n=1 Tax=Psychrobacter sp. G TaxID=571800 RepID=UPI000354A169|nr:hypothetical protein [Psychrobacter sp. G]AGP49376.1 hypothetical protein PSYCG_09380 [Psychrobacter sp. G]
MKKAVYQNKLDAFKQQGYPIVYMDESGFEAYSPDLNPIEKKWAQAKFLRQGGMENNLSKLFYDMGCSSFIVD